MPSQLITPQTWRYSGTFCIVIDYHHQYATERVILHWWLEIFDVIDNFGFFPRLEELFSSIITRVYESFWPFLVIFKKCHVSYAGSPNYPQVCLRRLVGNYQDTNHILLLQSVWPGGRKNNLADPSETILKCLILSCLLANHFNDKSLSVWVSTEGIGARCLLSVCSNLHNTSLKGQKLNDYISKKPLLNRNKELWLDCRMVNNLSYCHHILVKISKKNSQDDQSEIFVVLALFCIVQFSRRAPPGVSQNWVRTSKFWLWGHTVIFIVINPVCLMWQLGLIGYYSLFGLFLSLALSDVSSSRYLYSINKTGVAPALLSIIRVYMKVSQIAAVANF